MDTTSIVNLRTKRDEIKTSKRKIKISSYTNEKFGTESEYTAKGIIAGLDNIIIDITTLTKSSNKFIQISTAGERTQLVKLVTTLNTHITNLDLGNTALVLDQIKPLLRNWGIKHTEERKLVFDEHIENLQKTAVNFTDCVSNIDEIKDKSYELKNEIQAIHEQLTEKLTGLEEQESQLEVLIEATKTKNSESENILSLAQGRSNEIEELLANSKSHTELINGFSKKITNREIELEKQEANTLEYNEKLKKFKDEHLRYLSEAKELIESAKLALEYKTAEGLSAAFAEQYKISKSHKYFNLWLISAGIFIIGSIGLGVWISIEGGDLELIISRISMLPILIAGAWFSAGQYVKKSNIAEDYAYKSVLSKSIVGFAEQFSNDSNKGENYSHYIKSVLSQIHNDPLRKNNSKESDSPITSDEIKKALEEIKGLKKIVGNIEKTDKNS